MRHAHAPTPRALLGAALAALALPAVAAAQVAVFDGQLHATAGGFRFGDDTLQTTAATGSADYAGIPVVDQRGGGDFTTIQAAIDAIGTALPAASEASPYLVRVAPGVYSEQVTMKQWVDLEGAGEKATKITWVGSATFSLAHTVKTAENTELRFVTVENTGGAPFALGVQAENGDLTRVTVDVTGGTQFSGAVVARASVLRQVTAVAIGSPPGGATALALDGGSPTVLDVDASASGGTNNTAILIADASATIHGGTARATGTANLQFAVDLLSGSATVTALTMLASGGNTAAAFSSESSSTQLTRIHGSRLEASGAATPRGVRLTGTQPVRIHGSAIVVPTGLALQAASGSQIDVATSLLDGGTYVVGTYKCVASFDGSFAAIGSDCLPP